MGGDRRWPHAEAMKVAEELKAELSDACERIEIEASRREGNVTTDGERAARIAAIRETWAVREWQHLSNPFHREAIQAIRDLLDALDAERRARENAEAQRDALRAALAPFSKLHLPAWDSMPDDYAVWGVHDDRVTAGDFRRAVAALALTSEQAGEAARQRSQLDDALLTLGRLALENNNDADGEMGDCLWGCMKLHVAQDHDDDCPYVIAQRMQQALQAQGREGGQG